MTGSVIIMHNRYKTRREFMNSQKNYIKMETIEILAYKN